MAQVFSCEFCQISKNIFFTEHLWVAASLIIMIIIIFGILQNNVTGSRPEVLCKKTFLK